VDHDNVELTVKVDDPKAYTDPWLARDKLHLTLQPAKMDFLEMICAPTEAEAYKNAIADPTANRLAAEKPCVCSMLYTSRAHFDLQIA
jgi:hypothetical protein